jgi:serine/threonine-protein kinase RsbW
MCQTAELALRYSDAAPARARQFVDSTISDALTERGAGTEHGESLRFDSSVVASELISNAVRSGASEFVLTLRIHVDRVDISVMDDAPGMPRVLELDARSEHGRGLHIIAGLTHGWGVHSDVPGSKTVWASIAAPMGIQSVTACRYLESADSSEEELDVTAQPGASMPGAGRDGPGEVTITVPGQSSFVPTLRTVAAGLAARCDWPVDEGENLRLAVDEACTMLLEIADEGDLTAEFWLASDGIEVRVSAPAVAGELPDADAVSWLLLSAMTRWVEAAHSDGRVRLCFAVGIGQEPDS